MQLVRPEQAEEDLPRMSCKSEGYARSELLGRNSENAPSEASLTFIGEADGRGPHETEGDITRR